MNRSLIFLLSITLMLSLTACIGNTAESQTSERETASRITREASPTSDTSVNIENTDAANSSDHSQARVTTPTIGIRIGDRTFHAALYNNPSAKALIERLPLTLNMQELNGNEKYIYFSGNLPSDSIRVDEIQAGDLMLFGSDCLVLFYKSFSPAYSYTRLGRIEDPTGLAEALGSRSVSVKFNIEK